MSEDAALALLRLLAQEDGQSQPRVAKRLGLGASELQRLLAALGDDPRFDGLDLVVVRRDDERTRLWLTARGHALLSGGSSGEGSGEGSAGAHAGGEPR